MSDHDPHNKEHPAQPDRRSGKVHKGRRGDGEQLERNCHNKDAHDGSPYHRDDSDCHTRCGECLKGEVTGRDVSKGDWDGKGERCEVVVQSMNKNRSDATLLVTGPFMVQLRRVSVISVKLRMCMKQLTLCLQSKSAKSGRLRTCSSSECPLLKREPLVGATPHVPVDVFGRWEVLRREHQHARVKAVLEFKLLNAWTTPVKQPSTSLIVVDSYRQGCRVQRDGMFHRGQRVVAL